MVKLITYTDDRMTISATRCIESALKVGKCNHAGIYGPGDLSDTFKEAMAPVLAHERGAGFYCWKPYVIAKEMNNMQEGDYLIWSDAGTEWLQDVRHLIDAMDEDILFFGNGHKHMEWCKMDCATEIFGVPAFKILDQKHYLNFAEQVQASHIIFKITGEVVDLVDRWLMWTQCPGMIDNEPSILPNIPTFREHRWDQAILCCLQIQEGLKLHWFPSTMYMNDRHRFSNDKYPAMFDHHRRRNNDWE